MTWQFIDIGEYSFSAKDLQLLPAAEAGFLVASCFAVTEINALERQVLLSLNSRNHVGKAGRAVETIVYVNTLVSDRILSAKLVEYCKLCRDYAKKVDRAAKKGLILVSPAIAEIDEIQSHPAFDTAMWLRNNLTNHVILSEIEKFLDRLNERETYSIYLNEKQGNTWHPLGEQVAMMGWFHQTGSPLDAMKQWQDWIQEAAAGVVRVHNQTLIALIEKHFPQKYVKIKRAVVDDRLVGEPGKASAVLFWDMTKIGMDR